MLNNKNADNILNIMKRFADAGIIMNAQIVLCPGVNDGDILRKSLEDLANLMPAVHSASVVPVGISKHRNGLFELTPVTKESAADVIDIVEEYSAKLYKEFGTRVVYAADEFYIMAERDIPPYDAYEDFPQIENGVGMMASLEYETNLALNDETHCKGNKKIIATGAIAYNHINGFIDKIKKKHPNVDVEVYKIRNDFFGDRITVTGLLCGRDIINQLKDKSLDGTLLLARNMFKNDSMIFLDDTTLEDVERELGLKVRVTECDGFDFVDSILE